jgi:hypothetical protein
MKRFGTDPQLQKYSEWFVPLKLDVNSDQWKSFRKTYKHDGGSTPYVFIVRADGQKLYGSGKRVSAEQLYSIVEDSISKAGRVFSAAQASALGAAAESARGQLDGGNLEGAIKTLMSLKKIGMPGQLNSFSAAAIAADEVAERTDAEVAAQLEAIKTELENEETAPDAAVKMASAIKEVVRWLPRKGELAQLKKQFKKNPQHASLLAQAILYEEMSAARRQANLTKLVSRYRELVAEFEDGLIVPRGRTLLESAITPELATADDFFVMWQSSNGFRTSGVLKSVQENDSGDMVSIRIVDRRDKTIEVPLEKLDVVSQQLAAAIVAHR